jgi:Flp pilus assembly pilin Flp
MERWRNGIAAFAAAENGQDLIEYALLAALIATVSIVGITLLGQAIPKVFQQVNAKLR